MPSIFHIIKFVMNHNINIIQIISITQLYHRISLPQNRQSVGWLMKRSPAHI